MVYNGLRLQAVPYVSRAVSQSQTRGTPLESPGSHCFRSRSACDELDLILTKPEMLGLLQLQP